MNRCGQREEREGGSEEGKEDGEGREEGKEDGEGREGQLEEDSEWRMRDVYCELGWQL